MRAETAQLHIETLPLWVSENADPNIYHDYRQAVLDSVKKFQQR